ncbi:hypothetical protein WG954_11720 [Lacibacter sp. H375]|uniref:hypothetical protein n=1 Tax=Lacibacter sp. H375 TaxID=3133424 RepID=UPI0030BDF5CB
MISLPHSYKIKYLLISIAYVFFLYLLYRHTGIITVNEAEKYIVASQEFLKGNIAYTFEHHLFYSSYVLFITPFYALGGVIGVVIAQVVFNILAAICLKKSIDLILPGNKVSTLGSLIFLFSYPIQYWTLTLFSDNFFVCLISICLYYTIKKKTMPEKIFWLFLLLIQVFSRPPGVFLSTVFGCYYLYTEKIVSTSRLWALVVILFLFLFSILFFIPVETSGYIKPIAAGAIIVNKPDYDVPEFNGLEKSTLSAAYSYLFEHKGFSQTLGLYFRKLGSFFTLTRPYYSKLNNSILSLHYLLYFLAIGGLFLLRNKMQLLIFFLVVMLLIANLTALTYNEWHYRFTLAIFPFLIVLSVLSFNYILTAVWPRMRK